MNKKETNLLKDRIEELSNDKETIELYTELTNEELIRNTYAYRAEAKGKAEGRAEGLAEGVTKGRTEGKEETQLEIAKNLLRKKISKDVIRETTGLSLEKLEKLKKEL